MSKTLRIVLAQLNLIVGDIAGNLKKHIEALNKARADLQADVIVFPELSLTGYPPEDLLFRKSFIQAADEALQQFKQAVQDIYALVSHPYQGEAGLYNACSLIYDGKIIGRYAKEYLPNYGVFDEDRYFISGNNSCVVNIKGVQTGLVICEDLWVPFPMQKAATQGARIILSPNASPFETDKHERRVEILSKHAKLNQTPIIYVNNVGGQDELIFDGGSMVINAQGELCQFAGFFQEVLLPVDIVVEKTRTKIASSPIEVVNDEARIYQALVLAVRDYIEKNQLPGVIVGLSGGIDSALTIAIAVDALGKERVHAILMPSRHTQKMSIEDAEALCKNLRISFETISIEPVYQTFLESLDPVFGHSQLKVTAENIQARIRAVLLMALSNKRGPLVLTTGNRSELAVGYCTLYGDMAGGFAVLKDIPKTMVYDLSRYRNSLQLIIPQRILDRPPTAELAPNQTDQDTLPPYPVLDEILEYYINEEKSIDEIVAKGFDKALVAQVVNWVRINEYKRRQGAIGPRIRHKAFGRDRRYPITSGFKG